MIINVKNAIKERAGMLCGLLWSRSLHNGSMVMVATGSAEQDWTYLQGAPPRIVQKALSLHEALALLEAEAIPCIESVVSILQQCRKEKDLSFAMHFLTHIHKYGLEDHESVGNYVVPMLMECGCTTCALSMFHKLTCQNEFTWTSLIQGYIDCGDLQGALALFQKMQYGCVQPSIYTLQSLVKACAREKHIETGREMHTNIVVEEFEGDLIVGNTLVDFYGKCGLYEEAWAVLMELPVRDTISWNALIAAYAEHGLGNESLNCLSRMREDDASPDEVTFICCLKACGWVGAIDKGRELHAEIAREGFERYRFVGNSLVDMYGRFGFLVEACEVFHELPVQDVVSWNSLITSYSELGYGEEAVKCLETMQSEGVCADDITYVCSLKGCGHPGLIGKGQEVHSKILQEGYECLTCIGNTLVDMYIRNGLFEDAWNVFQALPVQTVVSWTALISGCAENGMGEEGLECWERMCSADVSPNEATFISSLKNCCLVGALEKGYEVHSAVIVEALEGDPYICGTLVDMYAKCESFVEAREVFDEMPSRDVVVWTALIAGYAEHGRGEDALTALDDMLLDSISPNLATFLCTLKACGTQQAVETGQELHMETVKKGLEKELALINTLVDMYGKCELVEEARALFHACPDHSIVSWNVLISACSDMGLGNEVLECLEDMGREGVPTNDITLVCAVKGCGSIGAVDVGQQLHSTIVKLGYEKDYFVGNTLVNMYAKCAWAMEAQKLFDELKDGDVVSWNGFILGYTECGLEEEVLNHYGQLQRYKISPNAVTFLCILKACASLGAQGKGQEIHIEIVKKGLDGYPYVGNILVDVYCKCGLLAEAKNIIDGLPSRDTVVWTALMAGYAEHGFSKETLRCLKQMHMEGIPPSGVTFLCTLKVWGSKGAAGCGWDMHSAIVKYGYDEDPAIGSALVDLYGKCGLLSEAQRVLDQMRVRLVAAWTSLIAAYVEHGLCEEALCCYEKMHGDGCSPDAVSYLSCLKACGVLGTTDKGHAVHAEVVEKGMEADELLCSALVDMYTKCGLLGEAGNVFERLLLQNLVMWTTLILGFACQGETEHVFSLLERMWEAGIAPDEVTLLSILTVCNHGGLVEMGVMHVDIIGRNYCHPTIEHLNCLLDLLGRAGQLNEMLVLVEGAPLQPNFVTWRTVLGASKKYGHLELGIQAFNCAVRLDEQEAAPFVLLSNICISWDLNDDDTLYGEEDEEGHEADNSTFQMPMAV